MREDNSEDIDKDVSITVEMTGNYDEVVSKLGQPATAEQSLGPAATDLSAILETVFKLDGGTRSAIADNLPADMHHQYDAEAVVDALQVLARYDLVVLEGNTWYPGPASPQ